MKRRYTYLASATVLLLVTGVFVRRCDPIIVGPLTMFTYATHERPRVFVSHRPLIPAPGSTVTIRIEPDLPAGVTTTSAQATLRATPTAATTAESCQQQQNPAVFECSFTLDSANGIRVYGGSVQLSTGETVAARTEYRFTALTNPADQVANPIIEVRVPVKRVAAVQDSYRVDTAYAHDPFGGYDFPAFVADVTASVFDGILADPVYRTRDEQLGFFVLVRDAFVTSYYSGIDTRCGQNPWPLENTLPGALSNIEVLGVLHRKAGSSFGIEGAVTGSTANVFRDCAGVAVRRTSLRTFSTTGGKPETALVSKHEFGHAAFAMGDEYTEDDATRRVTAPPLNPLDNSCCCQEDDGGVVPVPRTSPTTGTGTGTGTSPFPVARRAVCVGGHIAPGGGITGLPACDAAFFANAQVCAATRQPQCPSLAGTCVADTHWLGAVAPTNSQRPNVFPTEQTCNDALAVARNHPGVEDPPASLGVCRELCGPNTSACPCGGSEFWIVDIDPAGANTNDVMAVVSAARDLHGGTCQWCVETSLCVRWHRALGDAADATWQACDSPPKTATGIERVWQAFVAWLGALLAGIANLFRST